MNPLPPTPSQIGMPLEIGVPMAMGTPRDQLSSVASRQVGELGVTILPTGVAALPPPPPPRKDGSSPQLMNPPGDAFNRATVPLPPPNTPPGGGAVPAMPRATIPLPPPASPPPKERRTRANTDMPVYTAVESRAYDAQSNTGDWQSNTGDWQVSRSYSDDGMSNTSNWQKAKPVYRGGLAGGPPGGAIRDDWIRTGSGRWIAPEDALQVGPVGYKKVKSKKVSHHFDGRFMSQAPPPIYIPQKTEASKKALAAASKKPKQLKVPKLRAPAVTGVRTKTGRWIPANERQRSPAAIRAAEKRRQAERNEPKAELKAPSMAGVRSPTGRWQKASKVPPGKSSAFSKIGKMFKRNSRDPVRPSIQPEARKAKEGTKTRYIGAPKRGMKGSNPSANSSGSSASTATSGQTNKKLFDNRMKEIKVLRKMTMQFSASPVGNFQDYSYAGESPSQISMLLKKQEQEIQMLKRMLEKLQKENKVTQNNAQYFQSLPTV